PFAAIAAPVWYTCSRQHTIAATMEQTTMHSRSGTRPGLSRRSVLRAAAIGSVSAIATPHVRGGRAAGILTLGVWGHWVPGDNNTVTALCSEWGARLRCRHGRRQGQHQDQFR